MIMMMMMARRRTRIMLHSMKLNIVVLYLSPYFLLLLPGLMKA
jgi:hypothetical protein